MGVGVGCDSLARAKPKGIERREGGKQKRNEKEKIIIFF